MKLSTLIDICIVAGSVEAGRMFSGNAAKPLALAENEQSATPQTGGSWWSPLRWFWGSGDSDPVTSSETPSNGGEKSLDFSNTSEAVQEPEGKELGDDGLNREQPDLNALNISFLSLSESGISLTEIVTIELQPSCWIGGETVEEQVENVSVEEQVEKVSVEEQAESSAVKETVETVEQVEKVETVEKDVQAIAAKGQTIAVEGQNITVKDTSDDVVAEAKIEASALVDPNSSPSALEEPNRQVVNDSLSWEAEVKRAWQCGDFEYVATLMQTDLYGDFMTPKALNTVLIRACESGNVGVVSMLLKLDAQGTYIYRDINPAFNGYLGLVMACIKNHLPVVELLLKKCDGRFVLPGMEGVPLRQKALDVATSCQHDDIVAFLLQRDSQGQALFPELDQ